jgi:hypothetical protein
MTDATLNSSPGGLRARTTIRRAVILAAAFLLCAGTPAPSQGLDAVGDNQALLSRWIETRRAISKEKQEWVVGRDLLQNQIDVRQREIEAMRAKIAQARASLSEADRKREELVLGHEAQLATSEALARSVSELEARTLALLSKLPASVRDKVKPLSQAITMNPDQAARGLGLRFQNVVGILNFLDKAQREVNVTSEVRPLDDGSSAEVTALYLGLGQAYYVGMNGTIGGLGHAGPTGWTWTARNESAKAISDAIATHKGEQVARFILLPLVLR